MNDTDGVVDERLAGAKTVKPERWNDPKLTTGLSGPGRVDTGPGKLVMKASMKLHTRLAVNMFRGRRSDAARGVHAIQGLLGFAQKLSTVWTGAGNDDPIADLYLVRVEEAFDRASALLTATTSVIRELLSGMDGFEIDVSQSDKPVTVDMQFLTPWAWQGASLLRQYDELIRMCLTARHIGLLTQDEWQQTVRRVGNAIRHLFKVPDDYLFTGLRRFRMGGRIKRARSLYAKRGMEMPQIPQEVLSLTRRSRFAPPIKPYIEADKKSRLKAFQRKQNGTATETTSGLDEATDNTDGADTPASDLPLTEFAAEVVDKVVENVAERAAVQAVPSIAGDGAKTARPDILHFKLGTMATNTHKPATR